MHDISPISSYGSMNKVYGRFPKTYQWLNDDRHFYIYDNTKAYSAVNPGGYNFPNPSILDASVLDLSVYLPLSKKYLTPIPPSGINFNLLSTSFLSNTYIPLDYYQLTGGSSTDGSTYPDNLYLFIIKGTFTAQNVRYGELNLKAKGIICELLRLMDKILYSNACCDTIKRYDMLYLTFQALLYEIECVNKKISELLLDSFDTDVLSGALYKRANMLFRKCISLIDKKWGCGCG